MRVPGPRVLITDAVPMNAGDELLLRGLVRALVTRWQPRDITVLTHAVQESRRLVPDLQFEGSLRVAPDAARALYERADLVISTPGGFLSEHYDISERLEGFALATALRRPLALFAQSMGPFTTAAQQAQIRRVLSHAQLLAVREAPSRRHLAACGLHDACVVEVPDAAFLWPRLPVHRTSRDTPVRRVGLCLRRWPRRDPETARETLRKGRHLVGVLAARGVEEFVFVSTCQGVEGYIDDSDLAVRLVAGLEPRLADRCFVHRSHHGPEAFMELVGTCDLFVGMRLHGCLMALLSGTPALGLAYESKTPEIFGQLGLQSCQMPFTARSAEWCGAAERMLEELDDLRRAVPDRVEAMRLSARNSLVHLDMLIGHAATVDR
jgi:colanic acid/amylovoran biosynthesis protein